MTCNKNIALYFVIVYFPVGYKFKFFGASDLFLLITQ